MEIKKDKIIVYGLGKLFEKYEKIIEKKYTIIGYFDSDSKKREKYENCINDIKDAVTSLDFDYILIVSSVYSSEIKNILLDYVKEEKIHIWIYEDAYKVIWDSMPFMEISYTDTYEDFILDSIIRRLHIPYKNVKYIEVGVQDPIAGSNTYYFYKRGGTGVLVEANPSLISHIAAYRKYDMVINKAVYQGKEKEVKLYVASAKGLSSIIKDHTKEVKEWEHISINEEIMVPTIDINELFPLLNDMGECDILSIDIEGYDYTALAAIKFEKYRPKIIICELLQYDINHKQQYEQQIQLLKDNNYTFYACTESNGIFVDNKLINQI